MKTFRLILYILGALVLLYLGSQMGNLFKWSESDTYVEKEVILNRVDKVFKLVTVEGHYSELYHSWDAVTSRWLPLYTMFDKRLQKKTILRVNGKVSVGYDMEKLNITFDETNRKVVISSIPQPEILSIEHDLDYYDIDQGSFNKYDADDYNDMNTEAKALIRKAAEQGELYDAAREQLNDVMDYLRYMVEKDGWELVLEYKIPSPTESILLD